MNFNEVMTINLTDKKVSNHLSNVCGTMYINLVEVPNMLTTKYQTKITTVNIVKYYNCGRTMGAIAYLDNKNSVYLVQPISHTSISMIEKYLVKDIPTKLSLIELESLPVELVQYLEDNHLANNLINETEIEYFNSSLNDSTDSIFYLGTEKELIKIKPTDIQRELKEGSKYFKLISEKVVESLLKPYDIYKTKSNDIQLYDKITLTDDEKYSFLMSTFGSIPTKNQIQNVEVILFNHLNKVDFTIKQDLECKPYSDDNQITKMLVELLMFEEVSGIVRDKDELKNLFSDSEFMKNQLFKYRIAKLVKLKQKEEKYIKQIKKSIELQYDLELNVDKIKLNLCSLLDESQDFVNLITN